MAFRLDQAPLVDFCNQHSPRAHLRYRPTPASWWNERALAHVARRLRQGEATDWAGKLYPCLSARASHDDDSRHLRDGWHPSAGPDPHPLAETWMAMGRPITFPHDIPCGPPCGAGTPPNEAFAPSGALLEDNRFDSDPRAALKATSRGFTGQELACFAASGSLAR
jgi:hypothetical protein